MILIYLQKAIILGSVIAGTGNANVSSLSGSILDGGDTYRDIKASGLRMDASIAIGDLQSAKPLDIDVDRVTPKAGSGGIGLFEDDNIDISDVIVTVNVVNPDNTIRPESIARQSDLITRQNGAIVLTTKDGTITNQDGVAPGDHIGINADGTGNILIQAQGKGNDITFDASIVSDQGILPFWQKTLFVKNGIYQHQVEQ